MSFIPNFAQISSSFNQVIIDTAVFAWDATCEQAFCTLKVHLSFKPVLHFSQFGKPFLMPEIMHAVAVDA